MIEPIKSRFKTENTFWLLIALVCVSLLLRDVPVLGFIFAPFNQLQVLLHEMSHALACVMTGGSVSGLTIVEDGNGHGGLTFTHGGIAFIYMQAGYLGETLWGCLLIALSRFSRLSKFILMALGLLMGFSSIYFMAGGILNPSLFLAEIGSLLWGLALAAGLFYVGLKLSNRWAHALLLFLAVQSCLSSLQGIFVLFLQSMGAFPGVWSDATNMENMTHIPAVFWGSSWALFSIGMLSWTMWMTFKSERAGKLAKDKKEPVQPAQSALDSGEASPKSIAAPSVESELMELRRAVDAGQKIDLKKEI